MAIYIIDGKIGSGKTYYSVHHYLKRYFVYDKSLFDYVSLKPHLLLTNIDSFKLPYISLDELISEHGLDVVFTLDFMRKFRESNSNVPIVIIIDEAQRLFHRKYYNKDVFFLFQYSRHLGLDIYLIVQDVSSLAKEIRVLSEIVYHAVERTRTTGYNFQIKFFSGEECVGSSIIPINKNVFRVYKSMDFDEADKPKPVYIKYLSYALILLLFSFSFFYYYFKFVFNKNSSHNSSQSVQSVQPNHFVEQKGFVQPVQPVQPVQSSQSQSSQSQHAPGVSFSDYNNLSNYDFVLNHCSLVSRNIVSVVNTNTTKKNTEIFSCSFGFVVFDNGSLVSYSQQQPVQQSQPVQQQQPVQQ